MIAFSFSCVGLFGMGPRSSAQPSPRRRCLYLPSARFLLLPSSGLPSLGLPVATSRRARPVALVAANEKPPRDRRVLPCTKRVSLSFFTSSRLTSTRPSLVEGLPLVEELPLVSIGCRSRKGPQEEVSDSMSWGILRGVVGKEVLLKTGQTRDAAASTYGLAFTCTHTLRIRPLILE